jgi:hypothetical protein
MGLIELIVKQEKQAPKLAAEIIQRDRTEIADDLVRQGFIELLGFVAQIK